jgi:hypothetical protein
MDISDHSPVYATFVLRVDGAPPPTDTSPPADGFTRPTTTSVVATSTRPPAGGAAAPLDAGAPPSVARGRVRSHSASEIDIDLSDPLQSSPSKLRSPSLAPEVRELMFMFMSIERGSCLLRLRCSHLPGAGTSSSTPLVAAEHPPCPHTPMLFAPLRRHSPRPSPQRAYPRRPSCCCVPCVSLGGRIKWRHSAAPSSSPVSLDLT